MLAGPTPVLRSLREHPISLRTIQVEIFPSADFSGLADIVRKFLDTHKQTVDAACFGLPGAVVNGRVETTNLPWVVDSRHLAAEVGLPQVQLVNDLYANAHGIALLAIRILWCSILAFRIRREIAR